MPLPSAPPIHLICQEEPESLILIRSFWLFLVRQEQQLRTGP